MLLAHDGMRTGDSETDLGVGREDLNGERLRDHGHVDFFPFNFSPLKTRWNPRTHTVFNSSMCRNYLHAG